MKIYSPEELPKGATVLFVHYGDHWLRGSELCLIDMVKAIKQLGYKPVVWCNSPVLEKALTAQHVTTICSPMHVLMGYEKPRWNIIYWLYLIHRGCSLISKYKPSIVHLNGGAPAQWMQVACRIKNTPHVLQLHAHYGVLKDRVTLGFHSSNHIIGVSHAAVRALISDGMNPQHLHILPNSINAPSLEQSPRVSIKKQLGLSADDHLILSVGSLIERKGHKTLFDSLALLNSMGNRVYAAIIGDGPERQKLERYCRTINITSQVYFIGEHPNPFSLMRSDGDALVSTAKDEVFGLVLAEANLAKLPVIAPNIPGINSVVIHNKTGLLYQAKSSIALAKMILSVEQRISETPILARAYWRATTLYAPHKHTQNLLKHYAQAVQGKFKNDNTGLAISLALRGIQLRGVRVIKQLIKKHAQPLSTSFRGRAHG